MQTLIPFTLALSVGFAHAFEADHLVAVSSLVTQRSNLWLSLKDGACWGLGHTSTILLVGSVFILGRFTVRPGDFHYLEAGVGLMLVGLGVARLYNLWKQSSQHTHGAGHTHSGHTHQHGLAYSVGLVHGLAGSGALVLSVLTQIQGAVSGLLYLLLFGVGSIAGMMVAAGAFSVPFSARLTASHRIRTGLVVASAVFCICLGMSVLYENLPG